MKKVKVVLQLDLNGEKLICQKVNIILKFSKYLIKFGGKHLFRWPPRDRLGRFFIQRRIENIALQPFHAFAQVPTVTPNGRGFAIDPSIESLDPRQLSLEI